MTAEGTAENDSWRMFLKKHWTAITIFVVAGILVVAGAVYVYLWFVADSQTTGLVPSTLGLWTLGNVVSFILHAIFWELLLVGIPVIIAVIAGWQWWKRLPEDEKKGYHFGRGSRASRGGSGISVLFFVAFCVKVYVDGNWNVAISTWTLNYVVYSMVTILAWTLVIFGIPIAIGVIWWLRHEAKVTPTT